MDCPDIPDHIRPLVIQACKRGGEQPSEREVQSYWEMIYPQRWVNILSFDWNAKRVILAIRAWERPTNPVKGGTPHHKINSDEDSCAIWNG